MRAGRWTWVWGLAVAGQLWGSEGAVGEVVGRWTNTTTALTLFGSGVGWRSDAGLDAFTYTFADTNLLTLRFGGGTSVTYDAAVRGDELELTLSGATARYSRAASPGSACQTNLLSLEAAKAVFLRDNPGALRVSVGELVPAYLQTLPACEGGGHYTLGPPAVKPACSSHGTVSE